MLCRHGDSHTRVSGVVRQEMWDRSGRRFVYQSVCVCVSNICTCINAKLHVFKGARESPTQDNYLLCRNVINTNSSHYKSPSAMLRRAGCRPSSSRPLPLQHFPTKRENRKRGHLQKLPEKQETDRHHMVLYSMQRVAMPYWQPHK